MRTIYIPMIALLLITATSCEKLEQEPPIAVSSTTLTEFDGPLNAAYYYQLGAVTPMAVMGDFRADNAFMFEAPFSDFDEFNSNLTTQETQFFRPFYAALYKSILSANTVIENSSVGTEIGEAKFLRALSYFKLVQVFGAVTINLSDAPDFSDTSILTRQAASVVYNTVIIPDLESAMNALGSSNAVSANGRATSNAAQALLGKVHMHMGNPGLAEAHLAAVVAGASGDGIELQANYADVFVTDLNSEIIFSTRVSSGIADEYTFASEFWSWYSGLDTKSEDPIDPAGGPTIIAAFDAIPGDLRRAVTIDTMTMASPKFPQSGGPEHDWIELRLADVMLLYAEALNENGSSPEVALGQLDDLRMRAGLIPLNPILLNTQDLVREAIADERRLELAFEGQRWFDLVRTGTVNAEMGETVNSFYHVFPIPTSEISASFGVITQNPGY